MLVLVDLGAEVPQAHIALHGWVCQALIGDIYKIQILFYNTWSASHTT